MSLVKTSKTLITPTIWFRSSFFSIQISFHSSLKFTLSEILKLYIYTYEFKAMPGSGGFAVSRAHGGDRFYNPPAIRRHHQQLLLQQQQLNWQHRRLPRPVKPPVVAAVEAENRTDSDDSMTTLLKPPSVSLFSIPRPLTNVTNLDRLVESVTPFVPAQYFSEANVMGWRSRESELHPYYCLEDLWESFSEWSVYGVGVPLLLNGKDRIIQYYVPFLSGIQLYVDSLKSPSRLSSFVSFCLHAARCFAVLLNVDFTKIGERVSWIRLARGSASERPGEESDAESSRETSSGGSSDCEADRRAKYVVDGSRSQQNLMNLNSQRMNRISLRDKSLMSSSSDEAEICNSPGMLLFEYLEQEQPYNRKPLIDKASSLLGDYCIQADVSILVSQFEDLRLYRSCDLLPTSWISVAWYVIQHDSKLVLSEFRISFDLLSWPFPFLVNNAGNSHLWLHGASGRKVHGGVDSSSKISLPVFGLACYKLVGSILTPSGPHECQQENSLLHAADNWLRHLQVVLPDYQFFRSHYAPWR
ncbi:hypothetical protein TEA_020172 [Camellia sinensis var. sinensis]|uniref:Uncharacterized protein n=1 Tax=Camellia sinensis var. sinensis TaxID=542762 RepID=A0A4S4DH76_CAMSN|nr:hypothetical protein TEA_020172 [Camellia sinensis var. sinensis]